MCVGFEAFMMVSVETVILWVVVQCSHVDVVEEHTACIPLCNIGIQLQGCAVLPLYTSTATNQS
jgi:hypothetical protein